MKIVKYTTIFFLYLILNNNNEICDNDTFRCNAGTITLLLTRQISPSAGINPVPITNSRISANIP